MILFCDTETTGLGRTKSPLDSPSQPHIVQLAASLCTVSGEVMGEFNFIINNNVSIPEAASNVHGITEDIATKYGVPPALAMASFMNFYAMADVFVAHNCKFDKFIVEVAMARHRGVCQEMSKPTFCTMEAARDIVKSPPTAKMIKAGFTHHKSPNLGECIQFFFGEKLEGAHDAMVDVHACRRIYYHLMNGEYGQKARDALAEYDAKGGE